MSEKEILDSGERHSMVLEPDAKSYLYEISKWGKPYIFLGCMRMLYLVIAGVVGSVSLMGTLLDIYYYHIFHLYKILLALIYIPSIYFHYLYYHKQQQALDRSDSKGLVGSFYFFSKGIKWSMVALIIDFGLSLLLEFYAVYYIPQ